MANDDANRSITTGNRPNWWANLLLLAIAVGVGAPVYEKVQVALEPRLGGMAAFALGVLAALGMVFPVYFVVNWIVERERAGKTNDLPAMIYRVSILPIWVFCAAAVKNIRDMAGFTPWLYVGWVVVLLTGAVVLQRRRGRAWTWWVAVPVGCVVALIALPAAMLVVWLVAPQELQSA